MSMDLQKLARVMFPDQSGAQFTGINLYRISVSLQNLSPIESGQVNPLEFYCPTTISGFDIVCVACASWMR